MNTEPLIENEIILRECGNSYFGDIAHAILFKKIPFPETPHKDSYYVYELVKGSLILRAAQSSFLLAAYYMNPDRIMIYNERMS